MMDIKNVKGIDAIKKVVSLNMPAIETGSTGNFYIRGVIKDNKEIVVDEVNISTSKNFSITDSFKDSPKAI